MNIVKERAAYNPTTKRVEFVERHRYDVILHSEKFHSDIPIGTRLTVEERFVNGEFTSRQVKYVFYPNDLVLGFREEIYDVTYEDLEAHFTIVWEGH